MKIKDIAKLAGVSQSTVSKIINKKDQGINPETRERVLKIAKEYNYTPYSSIINSNRAKHFLIGVLVKDSSDAHSLIDGIMDAAQENGYGILLLNSKSENVLEMKHISYLCANQIDGLIWEPASADTASCEQQLKEHQIPFLFVNEYGSPDLLEVDYVKVGYILSEELIKNHHTNITCLVNPSDVYQEKIADGFQKCLYDHHIPYSDKMLLSTDDPAYLTKILDCKISGAVCSGSEAAFRLYEQLSNLHFSIPENFSITTCKNDNDSIFRNIISGVRISFFDLGRLTAMRLFHILEKIKTEMLPPAENTFYAIDCYDTIFEPASHSKKQIAVIGSINIDHTFRVNRLPQSGKTITIHGAATTPGGKGMNQAIGVARLGHKVTLIGKVGNDSESIQIFDLLHKEHVATDGLKRDTERQTGKAYIYLRENGESAITVLPGANELLLPDNIDFYQYLLTNVAYCLLSSELPIDTVVYAAKTAKKHGCTTILKPAALKEFPKELARYTDILVANKNEAAIFCPQLNRVEEQAQYFYEQGIAIVIITMAEKGCYLRSLDVTGSFPAVPFTPVDTTGGADAFIAALASYLLDGYSLEQSIRIAMYAAGSCISKPGVIDALIDKNTLEAQFAEFSKTDFQ